MANDYEDAIVKRIVKCYLFHKGEASTRMIVKHILETGYGLRVDITVPGLSQKMRKWNSNSPSWFKVNCTQKGKEKWWSLK